MQIICMVIRKGSRGQEECNCHFCLQEEGSREGEACLSHCSPWKIREHLLIEAISKNIKENVMIGNSQRGFAKRKSLLTDAIAFNNEVTCSVGEGKSSECCFSLLK